MSSVAIISEQLRCIVMTTALKGRYMNEQNQETVLDPKDRKPLEELRKQLTFSFKNLWNPEKLPSIKGRRSVNL